MLLLDKYYVTIKLKIEGLSMLQIIIILIVIGLIGWFLEWLRDWLSEYWPFVVGGVALIIISILVVKKGFKVLLILLALSLLGAGVFLIIRRYIEYKNLKRAREREMAKQRRIDENKQMVKEHSRDIIYDEVFDMFSYQIEHLKKIHVDTPNYIFVGEDIPFGRANIFLSNFKRSIMTDYPLFFCCVPSQDYSECKEYGFMLTTGGVYYLKQKEEYSENSKNKKKYYTSKQSVTFYGLTKVEGNHCEKLNTDYDTKKEYISSFDSYDSCVEDICRVVANRCYGISLFTNRVYESKDDITYQVPQINVDAGIAETAGVATAVKQFDSSFQETKHYMDGARGHGYAGEYANNTFDRAIGLDAESTAQVLDEHGRQVKAGADRTVNGVEIQTKYYRSASESVGAAFKNGTAIYLRSDGSGKMQRIEVPFNQYGDALKEMQKRIDSGQVPGVEPGESASDYVKRGVATYSQTYNIARAGCIEGVVVDFATGAVQARDAALLSAVIVFALSIWNGKDAKEAAKNAVVSGLKVVGKSGVIYLINMQINRAQTVNPVGLQKLPDGSLGLTSLKNPLSSVASLSDDMASQLRNSDIAKTELGKMLGLSELTGTQLTTNTLLIALQFGPDAFNVITGNISGDQFGKNVAVTTAALFGADVGNLIFPVVGGVIGGFVAGAIAKSVADSFVEDDWIKMFRILKEEFLEALGINGFNKQEREQFIKYTIKSESLKDELKKMYSSGDPRKYAREKMIGHAVDKILTQRKKITAAQFEKAIDLLMLPEEA